MSNMSYCRFQNTSGDMAECLYALENSDYLSAEERAAGKSMFHSVLRAMVELEVIDSYDRETLDALFDALKE